MNASRDEWAEFELESEEGPFRLEQPEPAPSKPRKPSERKRMSDLFAEQLKQHRLPMHLREHRFAQAAIGREWRFDFCFPDFKLAVEIEGLAVMSLMMPSGKKRMICTGRHSTPGGFEDDCEKYATAVMMGWRLVRFMTKQVKSEFALGMTRNILYSFGWKGAA
jgi:very-short-patch-repair endonuclease